MLYLGLFFYIPKHSNLTGACRLLYPLYVLFLAAVRKLTPREQMPYTGIAPKLCALFLVIIKYVQKCFGIVPYPYLDLSHPASSLVPANAQRTYLQDTEFL